MSYFLRNSAGFLIQLAGCISLCLLPFAPSVFRLPCRRVWAGFGVLTLLVSALFPLYMRVSWMPFNNYSLKANLYMLFFAAVFISLYLWVVRAEWMKKLLVLVLALVYATTQFLLVNLFLPLFPGALTEIYSPPTLFLYTVSAVLLFPLWAWMMKKTVREYLTEIEPDNIRREFGLVLTVTLLYFILLFFYSAPVRFDPNDYWWRYGPPLLFATAVLFLFYWMLLRESVHRKRDSETQRALKIQQLQYEKIMAEMENDRRLRHDMRHYLNGLNDLLERRKLEEMKDFLHEITSATASRENKVYCQNTTVNGLLQYYTGLARSENIQCQVQADCGDLTISIADLTVLFGNAMENAIHACRRYGESGWIKVQVGIIGGSLMIQISNACKEIHPSGHYKPDGSFLPAEAFVSPRAGGGCGLKSLSHTAQKYGGEACFRYEEAAQIFTTRLRLNLHPEML